MVPMTQQPQRFSPVIALLAVSAAWEGQLSAILKDLGIRRVRLLSNNPEKARQLSERGVEVEQLVPLVVGVGEFNEGDLDAKRDRMGHALPSHDELIDQLTTEGRTA